MPASNYLSNKLLEHQVGKAAYVMPTVYVGLSSTAPSADGLNVTEPTQPSYARIATNASTWGSASAKQIANAVALSFATATESWGGGAPMTHVVVFDASTTGNLLAYQALSVAKSITSGDSPTIPIGQLTITLT